MVIEFKFVKLINFLLKFWCASVSDLFVREHSIKWLWLFPFHPLSPMGPGLRMNAVNCLRC